MNQNTKWFVALMAVAGAIAAGAVPVKVGNPGFPYSVPGSFLTVCRCEKGKYMFNFMSPEGMMPDMVSDEQIFWLAVKPPVHGWVFSKLRAMKEFPKDKLEIAYDLIGKWTNWWLTRRDPAYTWTASAFLVLAHELENARK